ncbi:hypothetical protein PFISCL1PPCAC_19841 [Pristionchus fissidentatus]|uniref:SWIM-type domain-containing protein n=1 Tax=Pristionchus fissidentatus TaxID=1538716 RepID=A0AAV5WCS9_9BILA|nr:hypothetical protein PFISCL1PPCAC_19841 [Pristionchus fissidentatus]
MPNPISMATWSSLEDAGKKKLAKKFGLSSVVSSNEDEVYNDLPEALFTGHADHRKMFASATSYTVTVSPDFFVVSKDRFRVIVDSTNNKLRCESTQCRKRTAPPVCDHCLSILLYLTGEQREEVLNNLLAKCHLDPGKAIDIRNRDRGRKPGTRRRGNVASGKNYSRRVSDILPNGFGRVLISQDTDELSEENDSSSSSDEERDMDGESEDNGEIVLNGESECSGETVVNGESEVNGEIDESVAEYIHNIDETREESTLSQIDRNFPDNTSSPVKKKINRSSFVAANPSMRHYFSIESDDKDEVDKIPSTVNRIAPSIFPRIQLSEGATRVTEEKRRDQGSSNGQADPMDDSMDESIVDRVPQSIFVKLKEKAATEKKSKKESDERVRRFTEINSQRVAPEQWHIICPKEEYKEVTGLPLQICNGPYHLNLNLQWNSQCTCFSTYYLEEYQCGKLPSSRGDSKFIRS